MGVLQPLVSAVAGFAILVALFAAVEAAFPEKRGRRRAPIRPGGLTDTMWWFTGYGARFLAGLAALVAIVVVARLVPHPVIPAVSSQPEWLQLVEVLVLSDLVGYWVHRAFHSLRWLWPVHAVHHSIEDLDWLSAARVHPLDTIVHRPLEIVPVFLLGFSSVKVLPAYALLIAVYPIFLHANLAWDFGPLRLVIASPAFHRWHHTAEAEGIDRNYAALFPWLDAVFGTLHFPRRASSEYGLGSGQRMRGGFAAQFLHPLRPAITRGPQAAPDRTG